MHTISYAQELAQVHLQRFINGIHELLIQLQCVPALRLFGSHALQKRAPFDFQFSVVERILKGEDLKKLRRSAAYKDVAWFLAKPLIAQFIKECQYSCTLGQYIDEEQVAELSRLLEFKFYWALREKERAQFRIAKAALEEIKASKFVALLREEFAVSSE